MKTDLEDVGAGQALTIAGHELTVAAAVELDQLCQREGSSEWIANGRTSRALALADGSWLFQIPEAEGGTSLWLRTKRIDAHGLGEFYRGGDAKSDWGPARRFAKTKQKEPVAYRLMDGDWSVCDIGALAVRTTRDTDEMRDGDRLHFVTSRDAGGKRWLLYLDARHEEARGTGGLFRGERFSPENEVEMVL